jgi:hypothetical protein
VWGDTGAASGTSVYATADDGQAFVGFNNSSAASTLYLENFISGSGYVLVAYGSSGGACKIDNGGNLTCTGSKSAVVPVDGGARKVALYAIEGPENWFEDAGSTQLMNGQALVNLESVFQQTVNTGINYQVFLTPNGDCKGLYVSEKTPTSFLVRELGGGASSIPFDYRILAKRKGYEMIRLADKTEAFNLKNIPTRDTSEKLPDPRNLRK